MENMQKMGQDINGKIINTEQDNPNKQFEETDEVKQQNIKQSDTITKKEDKEK